MEAEVQHSIPTPAEWAYRRVDSARLEYLEQDIPFEKIATAIANEADPCQVNGQPGKEPSVAGCWRVRLKLRVEPRTLDLFFNGRDGCRGRYWQSPAAGIAADQLVIGALLGELVEYAAARPKKLNGMTPDQARASLAGRSAKIWVANQGEQGWSRAGAYEHAPHLIVARWELARLGSLRWREKAMHGRWAATGTLLDVKGGFIAFHEDGQERVLADKVDRAEQIHFAGFT